MCFFCDKDALAIYAYDVTARHHHDRIYLRILSRPKLPDLGTETQKSIGIRRNASRRCIGQGS
jgi:hypothetical protein